jgi:hypothetical protein
MTMSSATRLIASVLALASLGVPAAVAEATATGTPTLRVVRLSPFTVQGTNFKSREKVSVALTGINRVKLQVTANARGAFAVTFPKVRETKCSYLVRATGAKGSRATLSAAAGNPECRPRVELKFGVTVVANGEHFKPGELVKITIVAERTWSRTGTASGQGVLKVGFGNLPFNECQEYKLTAVGSRGSRFRLDHPILPC